MARLTQTQLNRLSKNFEERTPDEMLRWAKDIFGDRVAAISAMQKSGSVMCHMISRLELDIPVLFVDTGVMFQETLETRDRISRDYGLTVRTLHPELTMVEQTEKMGVLYMSVEGQEECCHMRKVEPLLKTKGDYDALIGSLRRADGGRRGVCPLLAVDIEMNTVRINPMANFTDEQMAAYLAEQDVIINPLHDQGYTTIGCNRCTTPVLPHEPKRAGRWRHLGTAAAYCGINPTDMSDGESEAIDLPQDLVDRILGQKTDFMI
ncbi:Phosphoadenosine phosphosulfate reductase [Thalassoglobus neptunius]|uniref:Adenosine 5'-phosphosulfate reductase n=1 Tax=Thalassoglobus neptunius TaxID=1938619 RepID=A0A5C5X3J3_9PLAN|nr:phosphoadenylyl-sulfate reductase [Thalassoglobus neptunius]TWT57526.1 Phosphoadenosine phosphosulfate reductase [Thalassoglobus neptunius]